jgi:hypothetical protein
MIGRSLPDLLVTLRVGVPNFAAMISLQTGNDLPELHG